MKVHENKLIENAGSFLLIDESSTDPFRLMSVSSSGEVTDLKP